MSSIEAATQTQLPAAQPASPLCRHCDLPVPGGWVVPGDKHQFCCAGCRMVFAMLQEHKLGDYYLHRGDEQTAKAPTTGGDYAEFDTEAFLQRYATRSESSCSIELLLEGIHCSACVWLVEKLPELLPGVLQTRLNYSQRLVHITWQTDSVQPSAIARALDRLGYPPHPHRPGEHSQILAREQRNLLLRLGVAGACAGNAMLLALALYSGALGGIEPHYEKYFRILSALVALPAIGWSAQVFFRGAWSALRTRTAHMDLPISLGIATASAWGAANVIRGQGDIYFDSVTALIFLLLVGRYTLLRQQRNAELSAGATRALTPHTARLVSAEGEVNVVAAESLQRGDVVEVLAEQLFPVDGTVVAGSSQVEMAWLTGESKAEAIEEGDTVCAGTTNLSSPLRVVATCTGEDTRAARLLVEVQKATQRRAPLAELADRLSSYFLGGVLLLAGLAFLLWLPSGLEVALGTAVALLIVTCPCALGLATPLAMSAALHRAACSGWLIKGGAFVEALAQPALIVFDKTGTLTTGHLQLLHWTGDTSLKPAVRALEQQSRHPVALALCRALAETAPITANAIVNQLGCGIEGQVNGQQIRVGSVRWSCPEPFPTWAVAALAKIEIQGHSPVVVAVDGQCQAVLSVGDPPRPQATQTLLRLLAFGHRLALLSGDQQSVVDHLVAQLEKQAGRQLFETARGHCLPESKLAWVEHARKSGPVFMIGDGVNDAGALAAATVGIAVHGGAEASIQAADVFATREGVAALACLFAGARRTRRVVQLNLAFSLLYNAGAASLTLAGAVSPLLAAVLMPLSSLAVVSHSYRRRTFEASP